MTVIIPIVNTTPVVVPAVSERSYGALDLKELKISRNGSKFILRASFLPYDADSGETLPQEMKWVVRDLVTYLSDKPAGLVAVRDLVLTIAAQAQIDPLADSLHTPEMASPEPPEPVV